MKRGCSNGMFNLNEKVYFTVIVEEKPYAVQYEIVEKIECADGFGYVIDALQEQQDPVIAELVKQERVGSHFRICGDSIFKTKQAAVQKAREYFQKIVSQLNEQLGH